MIAVYAGSFSPPTKGHLDIIRRSAAMFDEVVVAVLSQKAKRYLFSPEERREMLCDWGGGVGEAWGFHRTAHGPMWSST